MGVQSNLDMGVFVSEEIANTIFERFSKSISIALGNIDTKKSISVSASQVPLPNDPLKHTSFILESLNC